MNRYTTNISRKSNRGLPRALSRRGIILTSILLPLVTLGFTCEEEEESALREGLEAISGTCYSPPTITYQNTIRDLAWNYCAECHREDAVQAQEPFFMDQWEASLMWTDGEVTANDYIVALSAGEVNPYTFYYAIVQEYMPMSQAVQPTALEKEYVEAWMTADILREDSFYKVLVADVNMDTDGSVTIGDPENAEYVDNFLRVFAQNCASCHSEDDNFGSLNENMFSVSNHDADGNDVLDLGDRARFFQFGDDAVGQNNEFTIENAGSTTNSLVVANFLSEEFSSCTGCHDSGYVGADDEALDFYMEDDDMFRYDHILKQASNIYRVACQLETMPIGGPVVTCTDSPWSAWFDETIYAGKFNYPLILSQANLIYQRACGPDASMPHDVLETDFNEAIDCTTVEDGEDTNPWNEWFTAIAKPFDDAYGSDLGSTSVDDLAVRTPGANVLVDITYSASDSDSDYAEVSLWYSESNQTVSDDNLIVDCLETGGSISGATHTWDSTDVPAGEYYVWACIQDNDNVVCSFSDDTVSAGTEIPDGGI